MASHGRRIAAFTVVDQKRDWPAALCRRARKGIRPLSMRGPSHARIAGSTVREATIAIPTTRIVPSAKEMNVLSPLRNMPAIATITVRPEIRTA